MKQTIKQLSTLLPALSINCMAVTTISIDDALRKSLIRADVTCKGGLILDYKIKNNLNDSVKVIVPAGWRMNAVKENYQDVLVAHEQILAMGRNETKSFEIKGYCCEYTNSGPIKGLKYETGKLADTKLLLLAKYLNASKTDDNTEQYAVWAVSNNRPTANITGVNDSITEDLRKFVATIKDEPIPWYTLRKKAVINEYGNIHEYPIQLKANVDYQVDKTCYAWFYVTDSLGNKVGEIKGQWVNAGSQEYAVRLNIKGFKKGKYKMMLAGENETFIDKEFEI
ncbi:MAG: hypothetical protein J0L69_13160 [Bacteroidetes bacterium]|nr:hypothetical protein [Bacteroidota bacterium]